MLLLYVLVATDLDKCHLTSEETVEKGWVLFKVTQIVLQMEYKLGTV